eukprot:m.617338 g.617338  ORF g.617338 m.617338 type:complete len:345 (-) comp58179_c0_seq2:318-1352(-)
MVRLIGYRGVALCCDEMLKTLKGQLGTLTDIVSILLDGMPKHVKLPLFDYKASGCLAFYHLRLIDVISHKELQTDVFHAFREVGNAIICFLLFEQMLTQEEVFVGVMSMPLDGMIPTLVQEGENPDQAQKLAQDRMAFMNFDRVLSTTLNDEWRMIARKANVFTRERLCKGLSMFQGIFARLKNMLEDLSLTTQVWTGPQPANTIVDVDECNQFHRLWSALLFITCYTGASAGGTDTQQMLFGDGLHWAGCTLISLLGQKSMFEVCDFSFHIAKVYEFEEEVYGLHDQSDEVSIVKLKYFVDFALARRELYDVIFTILGNYKSQTRANAAFVAPPQFLQTETLV